MSATMRPLRHPRNQRGTTLIITLIVLVLVMLIGVSMVRTSTTDEKMAGNSRDRDQALQAAEAAIRTCLAQVSSGTYTGNAALLLTPVSTSSTPSTPNWEQTWSDGNSVTVDVGNSHLSSQPRCMFEQLGGAGTPSFRITGRAVGGSASTEVMLQATWSAE